MEETLVEKSLKPAFKFELNTQNITPFGLSIRQECRSHNMSNSLNDLNSYAVQNTQFFYVLNTKSSMEDYAKGLAESKWECPHESINNMTLQEYWQRHSLARLSKNT
ncbi:TPA: hypothetical protein SLP51_004559 [Klebsiella aerogenes]|uniref:hypothetical protein n=2 Tax=Klebsiella aerogenes TaxID=548 RepID=UPI0012DEA3B3|nr:hypothetical protein [Klebsiella aerogenes]HEJ0336709.1 hypothetical protein [Klebsiella aerogenes]